MGLAVLTDNHNVGLLLSPGQRSLGSVDFDKQVILSAVTNLACRHGTEGSVLVPDDGCAVIVKLASGLEGFQMATDLCRQKTSHVAT